MNASGSLVRQNVAVNAFTMATASVNAAKPDRQSGDLMRDDSDGSAPSARYCPFVRHGKFGAFVEGLTRYSVIVTAECPVRVIKGSKGCNLIRVATVNRTERELCLIFSGMTPIQARASFD